MMAGLVHDLGAFYMLYRATQYSALRERPGSMRFLIAQWHENIGLTVLTALGMPEEIIEAVRDHDVLRPIPERPKNLNDIVYIGNLLVGGREEWMHLDMDNEELQNLAMDNAYLALQDEILALTAEMRAIFN
jgi:HD superfamily phosphohydrolase YqeK